MKFSKDRIAKLAGIPQNRRAISENRRRAILREARKGEMVSRSSRALGPDDVHGTSKLPPGTPRHLYQPVGDSEDIDVTMEMGFDYYGDSNAPVVDGLEDIFFDDSQSEYQANMRRKMFDEVEFMDMDAYYEGDYVGDTDFEEMVDIDEEELKKEVRNIKRKRINEARLRAVIEDELRYIISEIRYKTKFK